MDIEVLNRSDIDNLRLLQPPEWNDIRCVFNQFIDLPFFHPYKICQHGELIAVGEAISNKKTAWIGNIIVHPDYRARGIGTHVTQYLVDQLNSTGCQSQLLLSTEMGKPLYEKLGFKHISKYIFLKNGDLTTKNQSPANEKYIKSFLPHYRDQVFALDLKACGEDRSEVLSYFLQDALVYTTENVLEGFYLPHLGDGLVIATNPAAGFALSKIRMMDGKSIITVPEQNKDLIHWAEQNGFKAYRQAYKMYIGNPTDGCPEMIYSRIGGYLG